MQGVTVPRY